MLTEQARGVYVISATPFDEGRALVLGSGFEARDLAAYAIGVAVSAPR